MKKKILNWLGLYTKTDMVTFGIYLLSDARKERIAANSSSGAELDIKSKAVHDADFDQWKNI
jgi:hypothetical protein